MAEKYNLNWHTFPDHLQSMFKDLYEEEKHSDVTLVCDDQTQFKAHMKALGILVISVIIKLQHREVFSNIFCQNMKASSILVITVIIEQHKRLI